MTHSSVLFHIDVQNGKKNYLPNIFKLMNHSTYSLF